LLVKVREVLYGDLEQEVNVCDCQIRLCGASSLMQGGLVDIRGIEKEGGVRGKTLIRSRKRIEEGNIITGKGNKRSVITKGVSPEGRGV